MRRAAGWEEDSPLSAASRAMLIVEARGHTDTHRGLTAVKDARLPTRSLSSSASHFLSSIICSFCLRRVSCICCRSLCHSRWASSRLLASTRRISPSYPAGSGGGGGGGRKHTHLRRRAAFKTPVSLACGVHLTPTLRRRGDLTGSGSVFAESKGAW